MGRLAEPPAVSAVRAVLAEPDTLRLAVQPIVDLQRSVVAGYEALTRLPTAWGMRPDQLFASAAQLGCSAQLSLLVLDQLQELRSSCPSNCFLTVNLDPCDLADPEVQEQFTVSWSGVILELTESAWPDDEDAVLAGLEMARRAGALVASDDVGAGYAGLLQLVRVRPDLVKVDRALVNHLGTDPAAESVLRLLGELASELDAWLLVEGVETRDQLAVALRLGVPLAQGWLFGRAEAPWPADPDLSGVPGVALRSTFTDTVAAFLRSPGTDELRNDPGGRPALVRCASAWIPAMTLAPSTPVRQAVQRALHRRDPGHRLAPLAVTDAQGALLGLVDIEPLVLTLSPGEMSPGELSPSESTARVPAQRGLGAVAASG